MKLVSLFEFLSKKHPEKTFNRILADKLTKQVHRKTQSNVKKFYVLLTHETITNKDPVLVFKQKSHAISLIQSIVLATRLIIIQHLSLAHGKKQAKFELYWLSCSVCRHSTKYTLENVLQTYSSSFTISILGEDWATISTRLKIQPFALSAMCYSPNRKSELAT